MGKGRPRATILVAVALLAAVLFTMFLAPGVRLTGAQNHIPVHLRISGRQFESLLGSSRKGVERIGHAIEDKTSGFGGVALAQAIRFSRRQARTASPQPIPRAIAEALKDYFPSHTLRRVRWTTAGRRISLGTVLAGWYYREGAVTLDEVVVFSNPNTAKDVQLWAHELVHVRQYEEVGIDRFARLYVGSWPVLEQQARDNAAIIAREVWKRTVPSRPRHPGDDI
ncbi:eCIS core domain-containing protein [Sphingomonas rubra]|uniref:eCIS core domain-containing protein n=1 Tax=Sphingomonas rubra TaxID=634430 RepID=A0A1I5Q232_9SPHN|nr:DUF4157 domain-containing protein [Sphingomonas rubra]SFP40070.1 protein of unknown function [Sphingomonas rubra]